MSKTAIITGASGGIGSAIARELSDKGYNLILHYYKNYDAVEKLGREIGNAYIMQADLKNEEEAASLSDKAYSLFGGIDLLVNNSGVAETALFQDFKKEDYDRIFDTNVLGTFNASKAVIPYMLKKHSGSIINISSIWGICGASMEVLYSASKAAIIGFTKALAKELGPSGIRVNAIAPGVIETKMLSNLSEEDLNILKEETPLMRTGVPSDVAKSVAFIASEDASFITGQVLSPNGGFVI